MRKKFHVRIRRDKALAWNWRLSICFKIACGKRGGSINRFEDFSVNNGGKIRILRVNFVGFEPAQARQFHFNFPIFRLLSGSLASTENLCFQFKQLFAKVSKLFFK